MNLHFWCRYVLAKIILQLWNLAGWVPSKCTFNSWQPWSCRYKCPFWLPNWVHWAHGTGWPIFDIAHSFLIQPVSFTCFLICLQGERDGIWAWHRINRLFNWLPLAALIEKKIICMHGGIGRSINHVEQIENLQRPITMEAGSIVLMDLLWWVHIYDFLFVIIFCVLPYKKVICSLN